MTDNYGAHISSLQSSILIVTSLTCYLNTINTQTWWSLLTMESLYSWLPSTIPVRGFENHSLKSLWEENTDGIRKCIRDHSSIKLFWSGVPVNSSLRWLLKASNVCHRWLLKFLMFCACKKLSPPKYYWPSKLWPHMYICIWHHVKTVLYCTKLPKWICSS